MDRRIFLTAGVALLALPRSLFAKPKPLTVLFVCQAGTAKSAIARELFRKRAKERNIAVIAMSRGLKIEDHVSAPLRTRLVAEGIDTQRDGFSVLTRREVRAADIVVSFVVLPASYRPHAVHDWTNVASVNDAYPAARADLNMRIDALLDAINAGSAIRH